ncbi:TetR/AcrR family transcriptional regulator [Paenibacillus sp. 1P07SE]|uniref:TetR/AcrR family transcriptional regulator n=1 Tax=Paenibacillus sp. 1P07SE TaxID=3132209 RepID=UPI0039A662C1
MNKKRQQSEQTKAKLAEAARGLFAQKGFKATSIEDIVAATGSSKGNIYYHFESKEGLFLYLVDAWYEEWSQQWEQKQESYRTTEEKLHGLVERLVLEDLNHPLTKAMDEFAAAPQERNEVHEAMAGYLKEHITFNEKLIREGMERGELRQDDARELAVVLEASLMGLAEMAKRLPQEDALRMHRKALDVFLQGAASNREGRKRDDQ